MLRTVGLAVRLLILFSLAPHCSAQVHHNIRWWEDYVSDLDKEGLRKYLLSWEVRCDKTEFESLVTILIDYGLTGPALIYIRQKEAASSMPFPLLDQFAAGSQSPSPVVRWVERFGRRGTEPNKLFRLEVGQNSFKIQEFSIEKQRKFKISEKINFNIF